MTEPDSVRWLLTISREWRSWTLLRMRFGVLAAAYPHSTMVHGNAWQGDQTAARIWVQEYGGQQDPISAAWEQCVPECRHPPRRNRAGKLYCPLAGFRRNSLMVAEGRCRFVEAFIHDHSKGATDCAKKAESAGLPTTIHHHPPQPHGENPVSKNKPPKGVTYTCSKGCGTTRSSYSAITTHESACVGQQPPDRTAPEPKGPR